MIGAYHQLWQIEKSFRMSKYDLRARPIYHHQRDSIEAHLTIVMAALAVANRIEAATGWIGVRRQPPYGRARTITIQAGDHTIHRRRPIPAELARRALCHQAAIGWTR